MVESEFYELITGYKNKVYNTCLGLVKNHEDAEDLAQEVFLEAYSKWKTFRGDSKKSTWLYRIAVNKSLEHLRRQKRSKRSGTHVDINEFSDTIEGRFYHPGVALEDKERSAILFGAIDRLPEDQQVAFTLLKVEGLSLREIAQIMKKSSSSVESLIHRAKQNLRKKLNAYYEKEG